MEKNNSAEQPIMPAQSVQENLDAMLHAAQKKLLAMQEKLTQVLAEIDAAPEASGKLESLEKMHAVQEEIAATQAELLDVTNRIILFLTGKNAN